VPGHWEGDLIFASKNSQIATLVERQARYVMMAKVNGKDTETVINALVKHAHQLPKELYTSLTWDRGKEWRMRTPTACFGSTFPKERTCRSTRKPNSTRWHDNSTNGRGRR
jgi:hypothetical protein